ncbi:hypothetical protein [Pseudomonas frederiksbergensis]|uniref:hypothetical protein n=1 Tax=Pseudomonas frederiksbergensis TaxID=104087 RepID=UPI003D20C7F0
MSKLRSRLEAMVYRAGTVEWLPFLKVVTVFKDEMVEWLRSSQAAMVCKVVMGEWLRSPKAATAFKEEMVAWPLFRQEGTDFQGKDGRMVSIPKGKHGVENDKGRMQAKG